MSDTVPPDSAASVDRTLADPAVQRCPYDFYAALHAADPVHYDRHTGLWLITRHDQLVEAARLHEVFSSEIDMRRDVSTVDPTEADALLALEGWIAPDVLSQVDPPRHTRFRRLVERLFTGPIVRRMHDYLDAHVRELIEPFAARGRVDFLNEFAIPLPIDVIADQLGLPRADAPLLKRWTDAFIETLDAMISAPRRLECTRAIIEFQKYFVAQREAKTRDPQPDLLSGLAAALKEDGTRLTTEEFLALCAQLLVAGNETTRNHLLAGMKILATDPVLQQRLRAEPELIPRFVEESIRLESPVQGLFRRCTRDHELGGVRIPAGARVVLVYGAANRDADTFPDPARLDLGRANAHRHVAFGSGIHSCIGRSLATAELGIAFRRLLERLGSIRIAADAPPPRHRPHFSLRGLDSLQLEFEPLPASPPTV
jgi:cytochrome P450